MKCSCDDWKKSFIEIRRGLECAESKVYAHYWHEFKYCPWCGSVLYTEPQIDVKDMPFWCNKPLIDRAGTVNGMVLCGLLAFLIRRDRGV
jgi:hypothetical protein